MSQLFMLLMVYSVNFNSVSARNLGLFDTEQACLSAGNALGKAAEEVKQGLFFDDAHWRIICVPEGLDSQ